MTQIDVELTVTIPLTSEQLELLNDPAAVEFVRAHLAEAYRRKERTMSAYRSGNTPTALGISGADN